MSWHYLPELVDPSLLQNSSAGEPSVPWKRSRSVEKCSSDAKGTVCCHCSQSGTTSEPLMGDSGVDLWMLSLRGSRAKRLARLLGGDTQQLTCGVKSHASLTQLDLPTSSLRTSDKPLLRQQFKTSRNDTEWFIAPEFLPPAWVRRICEDGTGRLPTPTATANQLNPSMMKHASCRNLKRLVGALGGNYGKNYPALTEWMMGWPIGWTALEPLGTDGYQQWLSKHGRP